MVVLHLEFTGNNQKCSAEVILEGIGNSWDAHATISGHPAIHELHIKYWLGQFLMPVFSSKQEAMFFEPLLTAIEAAAQQQLPATFDNG